MSVPYVAVVELGGAPLLVGGVRLRFGGGGVGEEGFAEAGRAAVGELLQAPGTNVILRCRWEGGRALPSLLVSRKVHGDVDEAAFGAELSKCAAALQHTGASCCDRAALDAAIGLTAGWEVVRITKPALFLEHEHVQVPLCSSLQTDAAVWSPLFSMRDGLLDAALSPLTVAWASDELARSAAASRVIARRWASEKSALEANAARFESGRGPPTVLQLTLAGPNCGGVAGRFSQFVDPAGREVLGDVLPSMLVDGDNAEPLSFAALDYGAPEGNTLAGYEPDRRSAFRLIADLAGGLNARPTPSTGAASTEEILRRLEQFEAEAAQRFDDLHQAVSAAQFNVELSLVTLRRLLERIVTEAYSRHYPERRTKRLFEMLEALWSDGHVPEQVKDHMNFIRIFGNKGAHGGSAAVGVKDLAVLFEATFAVLDWYLAEYGALGT